MTPLSADTLERFLFKGWLASINYFIMTMPLPALASLISAVMLRITRCSRQDYYLFLASKRDWLSRLLLISPAKPRLRADARKSVRRQGQHRRRLHRGEWHSYSEASSSSCGGVAQRASALTPRRLVSSCCWHASSSCA